MGYTTPPVPVILHLSATNTASINRSNTGVRPELEHPCSTGDRTDPVRPKRSPAGRTGLSDQCLAGPVRPVSHPARPVPTDQSKLVDRCPPIRSGWSTSLYRSDQSDRPNTGRTPRSTSEPVGQPWSTSSLVDQADPIGTGRAGCLTGRTGTARHWSDRPVRPAGERFGRTGSVRSPVEHGCSSSGRTPVFDRLMLAVQLNPAGGLAYHQGKIDKLNALAFKKALLSVNLGVADSIVLNYGASGHYLKRQEYFTLFQPIKSAVFGANGAAISILGVGSTIIHTSTGPIIILEAFFAPDLSSSLIPQCHYIWQGYLLNFSLPVSLCPLSSHFPFLESS
ncbi:hypothetical protein PCASD_22020 [Puccinia coronata f. sp. avenae]|uniref:Retrovirus-related Pol polyprotein from transposon TNT 1-94-like beta-barrel domain-containing protein n=1 Tax=Puccinia coronata f. sp. avenae TaxID=200324 RepID=A0A2N5TNR5_9BASI|nr:hypothetical protein PCASD_22020 [Puccinia coronata f. sp. avenae]